MESGRPRFGRSRGSRNVDSEQATTEAYDGRDRNRVRNTLPLVSIGYSDPKIMLTLVVSTSAGKISV